MKRLITSESVTEGHPDKVCDQISDAIVDAALRNDKNSRVSCEVCINTGFVILLGELTTKSQINFQTEVRNVLKDIGYDSSSVGFDADTCAIFIALDKQSEDIAMGVDNSVEKKKGGKKYDQIGAGDQGIVFGYACDDTPELMPLATSLAHKLTKRLTEVRKNNILSYLKPDGKAQVTIEMEDEKPKRIEAVVLSANHDEDIKMEDLRKDIRKLVIDFVIPKNMIDKNTKIFINPTGRFVLGGPAADSGLTGRKIVVDSYGAYCPTGGGAYSGKDPTKVDRSAAYMARYIAKNVVASGAAKKCQVNIAYAIGVAAPVSVDISTFGTSKFSDEELLKVVLKHFDLRPSAMIDKLDLLNVEYRKTTNYGHFGRNIFPWEKTDKKDALKKALKI